MKKCVRRIARNTKTTTCDAKLKFGPGERFLLGTGGALFAPLPEFEPFRFLRLFAGLWASARTKSEPRDLKWKETKNRKRGKEMEKKTFNIKL